MECAQAVPKSNRCLSASVQLSKKSFIRLFAIPRTTIAWNFSAITDSGG
jgi:hypothetical protein